MKSFLNKWFPALWLLILILFAYFHVFHLGLVNYDDNSLITDRMSWLQSPQSWFDAFRHDAFMNHEQKLFYRPVLTLTFIADTQLYHGSILGYHMSNLLFHFIACLLIYVFFRTFAFSPFESLVGAALFAVHPVLSQAVAWIPGRNDTLMTIFFLLGFISFRRYYDTRQTYWLPLHALSFFLALFTKEVAALLPLICVLYWYLYHRKKQPLNAVFGLTWVSVILLWMWGRSTAGITSFGLSAGFISKTISNLPGFFMYLGKLIYPFQLNGAPILIDSWLSVVLGLGVIGVLSILFLKTHTLTKPPTIFGLVWFILLLAPTLLPVVNSAQYHYFLEHRLYLPLVGLTLALLVLMRQISTRYRFEKKVLTVFGLIFLVAAVAFTRKHTLIYRTPVTYWQHAVTTAPHSAMAWLNLGTTYYQNHTNLKLAEADLKKSLELFPQEPYAHGNLASLYFTQEKYDQAEQEITLALLQSQSSDNYFLAGAIKERLGQLDQAYPYWEKAVAIDSQNWRAQSALTQYFYATNNLQAAYEHYVVAHNLGVTFIPEIEAALQSFSPLNLPMKK